MDTVKLLEPGPDRAISAIVLGRDLLHVDLIVELAKEFLFLVLCPCPAGAGLAGFGSTEFCQPLKRQVQSPDHIGLLVGRVGREPLTGVRVHPVGKALDDLCGLFNVHPRPPVPPLVF